MKEEIRSKIKEQTGGYLAGALGLVAGLAWNDAIKALIEILFPFSKSGVFAKFVYAVVITMVVVFIGQYLLKSTSSANKK